MNKVLKRLAKHNVEAKVGKWRFREKEIKCVGFVVSFKCRKPDPDKVRTMKDLQPHETKEDVISVLCLVVFYHEFIRNMSELTAPIQKLMKNVLFEWSTEQQKVSETLKNRISEKSCLEFPELDWYYELDKDTSLNGIGTVLFKKDPFCQVVCNRICKQSLV